MNTIIGFGSQNQGTSKVHGAPLGEEDGQFAKKQYGYEYDPFFIPDEVYEDFQKNVFNRGKRAYNKWNKMMDSYKEAYQICIRNYLKISMTNMLLMKKHLCKNIRMG